MKFFDITTLIFMSFTYASTYMIALLINVELRRVV